MSPPRPPLKWTLLNISRSSCLILLTILAKLNGESDGSELGYELIVRLCLVKSVAITKRERYNMAQRPQRPSPYKARNFIHFVARLLPSIGGCSNATGGTRGVLVRCSEAITKLFWKRAWNRIRVKHVAAA